MAGNLPTMGQPFMGMSPMQPGIPPSHMPGMGMPMSSAMQPHAAASDGNAGFDALRRSSSKRRRTTDADRFDDDDDMSESNSRLCDSTKKKSRRRRKEEEGSSGEDPLAVNYRYMGESRCMATAACCPRRRR